MIAEIVLYHLTCHEVDVEDDPPQMRAEDDQRHGEVMKFVCPACNHKVTLDLVVKPDATP
jgi:hypothetical protein